ncbi:MAG: 50S ribosomal protein L21 [Deltaproteobacteria bacterium]|nr:50S ribosomal protein L21 [Deltaproteobacteria bacterium]
MYAVIKTGGKQYRIQEGEIVRVEKLPGVEGQAITFNHVLFTSDGEKIQMGAPLVDSASVEAEITRNGRDKKVLVFKKKRRKGYSKKQGHRQDFTEVKVLKINA